MKLRKKLAVVLTAAMVASSVPVVTMAASTNRVVKGAKVIEKDAISTDAALRIKFDDGENEEEEFYLELTNAEWLDQSNADELEELRKVTGITSIDDNTWSFDIRDAKTGSNVQVTYIRQSDDKVRVNLVAEEDTQINLPLPIKAKSGEIAVSVVAEGSNTTASEGTYVFATTGENAGKIVMSDDVASFYDNGELSTIIVKENFVGSLGANGQGLLLRVELNNTDFEFLSSTVKVKGINGFAGETITGTFKVDSKDASTGYIYISGMPTSNRSLGAIEISGIQVDNAEKEIALGDLTADIKALTKVPSTCNISGISSKLAELDKTYTDVVVANIVNYGASIKMKDEKAVDIVAGRDKKVEFTVSETVDDTFVGGRTIEITLDSEEYDDSFFWIEYDSTEGLDGDYQSKLLATDGDENEIIDSIAVEWNDRKAIQKDQAGTNPETHYKADKLIVTLKTEGKDSKATDDSKKLNINNIKDEFTLKTNIYVPVDQKDKGTLELVAEMRGVDEFKSATAVNVINPFNVTFETTTLKVGLQDQKVGKIEITETDKEMLKKGDIVFDITAGKNANPSIVIEDEGKLTVTGDLKNADLSEVKDSKDDTATITLGRVSRAASTLTIEEMLVTVDRTVPQGTYDLEISGDAIDAHGGTLKIEDFIVIGTSNTQDLSVSNGLAKGTATFTMNAGTYTINGVEKVMDAATYIQDPGYTMVPVRYVAEAFGIEGNNIMFGKGTVTMFAGNRTVQLTNGSNIALVNGAQVAMSTEVVIKDGRTYAPIGEIARILGVTSTWDNETKTATFENK